MRKRNFGVRRIGGPESVASAGMSLIEVMIALVLLLTIAVGVLPLLTASLANNVRGWEATQIANETTSSLDLALQLPLDAPSMTLDGTSGANELTRAEFYTRGNLDDPSGNPNEGWWLDPTGKGPVLWSRTRTVRQYALADVIAGTPTPISGGVDPVQVHFKEVEMRFHGYRQSGPLGASGGATAGGDDFVVRVLKVN